MDPVAYSSFGVLVRPAPETNDFEVRFVVDGQDLIDERWGDMLGLDPLDVFVEPSPFEPGPEAHSARVARCSCGVIGCGDQFVDVMLSGDDVIWMVEWTVFRFRRASYLAELQRARGDHGWETPERTAARLLDAAVDRDALGAHGLRYDGASGRAVDGCFTAFLWVDQPLCQVLVHVPWQAGTSPEAIAQLMRDVLRDDPRRWGDVQYLPQLDERRPAMAGPGWRTR